MSLSNRITLEQFRRMPVGEIAALPAEELLLLQEDADAALRAAKAARDWLDGALALKYADRAAEVRRQAGKNTGTVRIADGDHVVVAELAKKVRWDQALLSRLVAEIRTAGEDPAEYVTTEYKVPERAWSAWPASIRDAFAPARTVEAGKATFQIIPNNEVSQ